LLLQFHQADGTGGHDDGAGHHRDGVAFGLFHTLFGVVAGRKLDFSGSQHILESFDAVLHR
jgi:hypothetical protein